MFIDRYMVKLIYYNIFIFYNTRGEKPEEIGEGAEGEAERAQREREKKESEVVRAKKESESKGRWMEMRQKRVHI